ncbi:ABC transporter permease subunit [Yinghuangia seranimata]|uniref:ABC transporter permease subunit n=1 Tax=Yinghuangia seranimata TaxID=408067 RepID=UPI00248BE68D|nr:ABC transporter permease subunit [Yinghuangia seranimata]MDI2132904.1 ABC transporter permease subunit [Yinghuangia seranimata]
MAATDTTPPAPPAPAPSAGYRSTLGPGRDGFGRLLHAEWTKLRTVRRWVLTLLAAVAATLIVSVLAAGGIHNGGGDKPPPTYNDRTVNDGFRFIHQALTGDGTITARITGVRPVREVGPGFDHPVSAPWAKGGLMVKTSTTPGSDYAAVMLTERHGVRFQAHFVDDTAGSSTSGDDARWLRLVRTGDTVTGYESADGTTWHRVGTTHLSGLPQTVEVGLFATSPEGLEISRSFGSTSVTGGPTRATAGFEKVAVQGTTAGAWQTHDIGQERRPGPPPPDMPPFPDNESTQNGDAFTITGSGDVGPMDIDADAVRQSLSGALIGLIPIAALGVLFITAEFKKGMIRTSFLASPRRGRVLAAKALVLGAATFVAGLLAAVPAFLLGRSEWKRNGFRPPVYPDLGLGDGPVLRAVVGTGLVLALVAVLALSVGVLVRNTAAAVAIVVVVLVLPQMLMAGLPVGAARFLSDYTPIAGFSIQSTTPNYPQVDGSCLPEDGCHTYAPWTGPGVLLAYTAVLFALAVWRLRRRSA